MHYQHFLGLGVQDLEVGNANSDADAPFVATLAKKRKAEDLSESRKYSWIENEVAVAVAIAVAVRWALVAM